MTDWSWIVIGRITAGIVLIDILLLAVLTTIITIMRRPSKTVNQLRGTASMASMALTQNPGYKVTRLPCDESLQDTISEATVTESIISSRVDLDAFQDPIYDYPLLRFSRPSEPQRTLVREDTVDEITCPNPDMSQNPFYDFEHSPSTDQDLEDMAPQVPHMYDVIA